MLLEIPHKILVVDDERSMRELLEILLLKHGYDVQCAESGSEALNKIQAEPFDLVITDIRMQPVNGLEVLKQCKAISPRTIVMMISAYASAELAVEAMNEGAYDYFPKPFNNEEILSVISNALSNRGDDHAMNKEGEGPLYFGCLIGESPPMRKIYQDISTVFSTRSLSAKIVSASCTTLSGGRPPSFADRFIEPRDTVIRMPRPSASSTAMSTAFIKPAG